jgi:hypothetical protein
LAENEASDLATVKRMLPQVIAFNVAKAAKH